jgi:hypothetical protein
MTGHTIVTQQILVTLVRLNEFATLVKRLNHEIALLAVVPGVAIRAISRNSSRRSREWEAQQGDQDKQQSLFHFYLLYCGCYVDHPLIAVVFMQPATLVDKTLDYRLVAVNTLLCADSVPRSGEKEILLVKILIILFFSAGYKRKNIL